MKRYSVTALLLSLMMTVTLAADTRFHAGAIAVDISPRSLPAIRNGGFLQAVWNRVDDPLHCRCLILSDGRETIAFAIVDSCMFPTDICDAIKSRVAARIGLAADRILIGATHTHSAPSVMSMCLGTSRDEAYTEFVVPRVVDAIVAAHQNMQPARIGWNSVDAAEFTHCRRWITRGDRMGVDPFGDRTVRAMMHPGYLNPDYVCPAGPIDPELSVISVVADDDEQPICVMANFSMHYFGTAAGFSADYFGDVAGQLESNFESAPNDNQPFVGIMSQGTSGDLHWMDYAKPQNRITRQEYAEGVAAKIIAAQQKIEHRNDVTLAMTETRLNMKRRIPDPARLAWAKSINDERGDLPPRNQPEVYAQQAQWIDGNRETELVLQAIRIGDLAITALPNEVYGITGLKLKQRSPLLQTFNLELAGGAEGYIPPPEQHHLGGYTTWPARTAGLEEQAEPKIVETMLGLLEQVSGKKRRAHVDPPSEYSTAVSDSSPTAFWRLGDIASDRAVDALGRHHGIYEGGVAVYLSGLESDRLGILNRCPFFAGGRVAAPVTNVGNQYSIEMWFRNEMPIDSRPVTGYVYSRGVDGDVDAAGDSLGIGGTHSHTGKLFVFNGNRRSDLIAGKTELAVGRWYHVAMIRSDQKMRVFLDGELELDGDLPITYPPNCPSFHIGGRNDNFANFDGQIDEVALYNRALAPGEIGDHLRLGN